MVKCQKQPLISLNHFLLMTLVITLSLAIFSNPIFISEVYGQYPDIAQLESEKITFEFDEKSYDLYYGYKGSLDSIGEDHLFPTLSSMNLNQERKSLEIVMEEVPEKTDFWVRMPFEVITAENEKFTVLVDGEDTRYDLMKFPNDYVVGFIITEETEHIEIIGTSVIPEFGVFAILILGISILGLIFFVQKSPFGRNWTRIN